MIPHNFRGQLFAEYEMKPGIKVYCVVDVVNTKDHGQLIECTVGVRALGDTFLPVGSKILLKSALAESENTLNQMAVVKEVNKAHGQKMHYLHILEETLQTYQRELPRAPLEVSGQRGDRVFFKTANVSLSGAQLVYDSVLTSAVLGQQFTMELEINGVKTPFEAEVCYIVYNWWDTQHKVGVRFLNLDKSKETILEEVVLPALSKSERLQLDQFRQKQTINSEDQPMNETLEKPAKELKTMIDPESGRIRFDH